MGLAAQQHQPVAIDWAPEMATAFDEVFDNLTDGGRKRFDDEVNQAVLVMLRTGDSHILNETLHAWYRSLLVMRSGFNPHPEQIASPDEAMDIAEVRAFLSA